MAVLGKIPTEKAYQTSDGKIFYGKDALEKAQDHERWLARTRKEEEAKVQEDKKCGKKKRKKKKKPQRPGRRSST